MTPSDAQSAATGRPAAMASASIRSIMDVRIPRRRCVGRTPTNVTAEQSSSAPGTASRMGRVPSWPTSVPPS
ncbi:hypothetical protein LUX33_12965 [Actinomadura madurae]|nr:hypothetical protein [Actinomadura madurae]MCP9949227.1 hypothetical protein [Actinomadura madurae]